MDNLREVRTFLKDLIEPIVVDAVKQAIPDKDKNRLNNKMPLSEVTRTYGISLSTIYYRFNHGILTKYKSNGLTFVDIEELEASMKPQKLCEIRMGKSGRNIKKH